MLLETLKVASFQCLDLGVHAQNFIVKYAMHLYATIYAQETGTVMMPSKVTFTA